MAILGAWAWASNNISPELSIRLIYWIFMFRSNYVVEFIFTKSMNSPERLRWRMPFAMLRRLLKHMLEWFGAMSIYCFVVDTWKAIRQLSSQKGSRTDLSWTRSVRVKLRSFAVRETKTYLSCIVQSQRLIVYDSVERCAVHTPWHNYVRQSN